ncbi:MAG: alanine racemase [Gemmatimonadaceae bacterium]
MSLTRRTFLSGTVAAAATTMVSRHAIASAGSDIRVLPGSHESFDPWIEIIANSFRHNAREVSRVAGGKSILAVVKNNAYGLGDSSVGPLLDSCPEIGGIACVRPREALSLRTAGVKKSILTMSELGEDESADLVRRGVTLSCWLEDAPARLKRIAKKARRRVPVHAFVDTGMNREGMPVARALPWMESLVAMPEVRVDGTYQMFVHEMEFNRVQLGRFKTFLGEVAARGIKPGIVHASPTYELYRMPEAHFDMVRVGNALFGASPGPDVTTPIDLKPVFRLCARVTRVEVVEPGESAGFRRAFMPAARTRVATIPVGHTDGYPDTAGGRCKVLIGGQLYPVVPGGVASAHTLVDVGLDAPVTVGDTVTLIGPDAPDILPLEVGARTEVGFFFLRTRLSALLPRKVV